MTKDQLVEAMANDANISKQDAKSALQAMLDGIEKALVGKSGKITLTGFGTFSKVRRKARRGVNPATGDKISIKAHNSVKFQPGKKLKENIA